MKYFNKLDTKSDNGMCQSIWVLFKITLKFNLIALAEACKKFFQLLLHYIVEKFRTTFFRSELILSA